MITIWFALAIGGAQLALLVWSAVAVWRLNQRLLHAAKLDAMLQSLCVQAFIRQQQPIWTAWTAAMGDIVIEVQSARKWPQEEL